jgi:hypothetical protein
LALAYEKRLATLRHRMPYRMSRRGPWQAKRQDILLSFSYHVADQVPKGTLTIVLAHTRALALSRIGSSIANQRPIKLDRVNINRGGRCIRPDVVDDLRN